MQTQSETAVRFAIEVEVPAARAFQLFTQEFDRIKPREHNLLNEDIAETVLEPWEGGRIYDRGVSGASCQWGRVLAVEAPRLLLFSWDISPEWQLESDPQRASEVEVTFTAVDTNRTLVELEHRHLDRHGDGWQSELDAVADDQGWPLYLDRYITVVTTS